LYVLSLKTLIQKQPSPSVNPVTNQGSSIGLLFEIKLGLVRVEKDFNCLPIGNLVLGDLRIKIRKHPSASANPDINQGSLN
jgi:hypothetical protein